jgi:putative membrane protein
MADWLPRDRPAVERELERIVRENRVTIAVVFPLVGGALLLASAWDLLPPILAYNPLLVLSGTLVMRLPLVAGLLPLVNRRALAGLGALAVFTYGIELVAVKTGWPYGHFAYEVSLGPMLFDTIPLALPLFFFPIALNATLFAVALTRERSRVTTAGTALALVILLDLILDPAAVALDFWGWIEPGAYYGVPAQNYAGWLLSGTVAVVLVALAFDRSALAARLDGRTYILDDLVSFVILWGAINLAVGNLLPAALAAGLGGAVVVTHPDAIGRHLATGA